MDQLQQRRRGAQHGIGGPNRLVGDPVPERWCTVDVAGGARVVTTLGDRIGRPAEDSLDEGRESVEREAEHQDVVLGQFGPGFGEEVQDRVTHHLHLSGRSETGVELHRAVPLVERQASGLGIGPDAVLEATEQGAVGRQAVRLGLSDRCR